MFLIRQAFISLLAFGSSALIKQRAKEEGKTKKTTRMRRDIIEGSLSLKKSTVISSDTCRDMSLSV